MAGNNDNDERFKQTHIYLKCQKWFLDVVKEKAKRSGKSTMSGYLRGIILDRWQADKELGESLPWDKVED